MLAEVAPFLSRIPGSPTQQLVIAYHWPELVSGPSLCARKIEKCSWVFYVYAYFCCFTFVCFLSECITTSEKLGISK